MTDHQTLEWLLTKLRSAEGLNDWLSKRIGELEAEPAVEVAPSPGPWVSVLTPPPYGRLVILRAAQYVICHWTISGFFMNGVVIPHDPDAYWMLIPECDK